MNVQTLDLRLGPNRRPAIDFRLPEEGRRSGSPGHRGDRATVGTRQALLLYTSASIVAGLAALTWTTLAVPIAPAIDPGLDGTALQGTTGGLLLWIGLGLFGSMRTLPVPGSAAVWTLHFPFIAAAAVLGGPTAGAWVGFLSTFERRELASQPWYGVLANHAVLAFAAVLGGLTVQVVAGATGAVIADHGVASLIAIALGTLVLAGVANGMAAGTVMLRQGLPASSLIEMLVRAIGVVTIAEIVFAWMLTIAYLAVGWWAPVVLALVAVSVVPALGTETIDPLTRLPNLRTFERLTESTLKRVRLGLNAGGVVMMIDLDEFGPINKDHGFAVGNEALAEIGRRLGNQVRATDVIARLGGDEFAAWFSGTFDAASALALGQRIDGSIRLPIATSKGPVAVGVSIGVVIVPAERDVPSLSHLLHTADMAMQREKQLRKGGGVTLVAYQDGKVVSDNDTEWQARTGGAFAKDDLPAVASGRSVQVMISVIAAAAALFAVAAAVSLAHLTL